MSLTFVWSNFPRHFFAHILLKPVKFQRDTHTEQQSLAQGEELGIGKVLGMLLIDLEVTNAL